MPGSSGGTSSRQIANGGTVLIDGLEDETVGGDLMESAPRDDQSAIGDSSTADLHLVLYELWPIPPAYPPRCRAALCSAER